MGDAVTADPLDPVEALRLSSALLALLPECKGATHSEAVSHCAECCFGSGYELHGPEDQVILDAAIALAAIAALPAPVPEGVPEDPAQKTSTTRRVPTVRGLLEP